MIEIHISRSICDREMKKRVYMHAGEVGCGVRALLQQGGKSRASNWLFVSASYLQLSGHDAFRPGRPYQSVRWGGHCGGMVTTSPTLQEKKMDDLCLHGNPVLYILDSSETYSRQLTQGNLQFTVIYTCKGLEKNGLLCSLMKK